MTAIIDTPLDEAAARLRGEAIKHAATHADCTRASRSGWRAGLAALSRAT